MQELVLADFEFRQLKDGSADKADALVYSAGSVHPGERSS